MTTDALARTRAHVAAGDTHAREEDSPAREGGGGWRRAAFLATVPLAVIALLLVAGPLQPLLAALTVLAGVALVFIGLRRRHRREARGHLEVTAGSPWPWHLADWLERRRAWRDLHRVEAQWPFVAERGGIPGARLLAAGWGQDGYWLRISAPGRVLDDLDVARLHSATQLHARFEVVVPDPLYRPWELTVREMEELEAGPVPAEAEG